MSDNSQKALVAYFWLYLLICLLYSSSFYIMKLSYSPPDNKLLANINEKINPNNAHWLDMMDLPGIGAEKAWAIYQYRLGHTSRAFGSAKDLTKVPGIGIITAQRLQDYLEFDPDPGQE